MYNLNITVKLPFMVSVNPRQFRQHVVCVFIADEQLHT